MARTIQRYDLEQGGTIEIVAEGITTAQVLQHVQAFLPFYHRIVSETPTEAHTAEQSPERSTEPE